MMVYLVGNNKRRIILDCFTPSLALNTHIKIVL